MKKKKVQQIKREWYIVLSDYGYFSGLAFGGEPQWSAHIKEAKPLDHMNKFYTLQSVSYGLELIFEFI
jgi:hypothetical protein